MDNKPWCAVFLVAYKAGIPTSMYKMLQLLGTSCKKRFYKSYYQTQTGAYTPRCGDIVFFQSNGASHTGLVIRCEGSKMYTVEGNTSDRVLKRWYYYKSYNKITGYGVPGYPASSTPIKNFSVSGATFGGGVSTT